MKSDGEIDDDIYEIMKRVKEAGKRYAWTRLDKAQQNLIKSALDSNYIGIPSASVESYGAKYKGLYNYCITGNYMDLFPNDRLSHTIQEDYLREIGRSCTVTWDSRQYNNNAFRKIRRTRGPKDFERRLTKFLKRQIDSRAS